MDNSNVIREKLANLKITIPLAFKIVFSEPFYIAIAGGSLKKTVAAIYKRENMSESVTELQFTAVSKSSEIWKSVSSVIKNKTNP